MGAVVSCVSSSLTHFILFTMEADGKDFFVSVVLAYSTVLLGACARCFPAQ